MKRSIFAFAFILSIGAAQAESFECSFTEPFISIKYNTATQKLTVKNEMEGTPADITTGVTYTIASSKKFLLKSSKGQLLATLVLNNKGSDGMSDFVYPYEITSPLGGPGANGGVGGCSSSALKAKNPNN